jgi:hypothetical protein
MNAKGFFFISSFSFLIVSCKQENLKYEKPYFDIDSLVQSQIRWLARNKVSVLKRTSLDANRDSVTAVPDTSQWKHELDAFQQMDVINKPMYKLEYRVEENRDIHSNLMVRSYVKIKSKVKSPVTSLNIFYQDNFKKIRRIASSYEESNLMYSTSRKLILEFEDHQTDVVLVHYKVQGFQKMILSDPVNFSIEGTIKFRD